MKWKAVWKRGGQGVEKGWKRGGKGVARRNARGRLKPYGLVRLILPLGLNASHGLALKGLAEFIQPLCAFRRARLRSEERLERR